MRNSLILAALGFVFFAPWVQANENAPRSWIEASASLSVLSHGRVMPLESYASFVYAECTGKIDRQEALAWLLAMIVDPDTSENVTAFRLSSPDLLDSVIDLPPGRKSVSYAELKPALERIDSWQTLYESDTTPFGLARRTFAKNVSTYERLRSTFRFDEPRSAESPWTTIFGVPVWYNPQQALSAIELSESAKTKLSLLLYWYRASKDGNWDEATTAMRAATKIDDRLAGEIGHPVLELVEARIPWSLALIVAAVIGIGALWIPVRRSGSIATISILVMATILVAWIAVRMAISQRPPIVNLPTTFLFASTLVSIALVVVSIKRADRALVSVGIGTVVALLGLSLSSQGSLDPFAPLPAVLNTNFWLSIHVPIIVVGYVAVLISGLLGHVLLIESLRKRSTKIEPIDRWIRTFLAVGLFFTLSGTLLGGIWADQSWGRFWGWDPKENGALLIVLWTAITIHLKAAGSVSPWVTSMFASIGVLVLLFSWIGVNLIGVGNHSYGYSPDRGTFFVLAIAIESAFLGTVQIVRTLKRRR